MFVLAATLTMSVVSAEDLVTLDATNSAQNSQMKSLLTDEQFYLDKMKQDLNVFEKDQVYASLGTIYLQRKEYGKALKYLEQLGVSWEQDKKSPVISAGSYNLAMIYVHGKGIPKDYPKAFAAFARATWGGNEPAVSELYVMCRDKEVSAEMIRNFTIEQYNIYAQGVDHPFYVVSASNLNAMYACESEKPFIDNLLGRSSE
jgi:hypothetical protein